MKILRRALQDERGSSIVELALVGPILAGLVVAIIDLGKGYSEKLVLEQHAQRSVEKAMQGVQGDSQTSLFQPLRVETAAAAGVDPTAVTVRYWLECNGVSQNTSSATMDADYRKVCPEGQVYSRFLEVRITKAYTPTFNMPWLGANAEGKVMLKARAGLRVQ